MSLGTVKFGRNRSLRYPKPFDIPSDEHVVRLLQRAHAMGVNCLDTAPAYGSAERRLGELLPGARSDWILCSKFGETFDPHTGQSSFDFSPAALERCLDQSLRHLQTDHLDILLLHSDGNDQAILSRDDTLCALQALRSQGVIRATGISSKTIQGALQALELLDLIMVVYRPDDTSHAPVLDAALRLGKGVLLKKIFNSGHADATGRARALTHGLLHPATSSMVIGTLSPDHLTEHVQWTSRHDHKPL